MPLFGRCGFPCFQAGNSFVSFPDSVCHKLHLGVLLNVALILSVVGCFFFCGWVSFVEP